MLQEMYWENNHAAVFGGAIYFSDYSTFSYCVPSDDLGPYTAKEECKEPQVWKTLTIFCNILFFVIAIATIKGQDLYYIG